jgi:acetoin utilization protein AcuB
MIAKDLISLDLPFVTPNTDGITALSIMDEEKVSHLPVLEEGNLIGIISEKILLDAVDPDLPISSLKSSFLNLFVSEKNHIFDLLGLISAYNLTVIPVISKNEEQFLGCVRLTDLLNKVVSIGSFNEPGSIIVLRVETVHYSLSEISRIVESNDGKILSLFVNTVSPTELEITLKINLLDNRPIIQTFKRYQYQVYASYQNAEYNDPALERFEGLLRYLNT